MTRIIFKNTSSSGFTLLEMLVVTLVIGILAAIATPSWLSFVNTRRLNVAQDQVYRAMRQAQSQATKHKLAWQVSFRKNNNDIVQWAVHQAEAEKFIPDAVKNNGGFWHDLESNIRIDNETTLRQDNSGNQWRVIFNYQGCPVYEVGNECINTSLKTLGHITLYSEKGSTAKRCVYVSTILGAMRTGKDHPTKAKGSNNYCY